MNDMLDPSNHDSESQDKSPEMFAERMFFNGDIFKKKLKNGISFFNSPEMRTPLKIANTLGYFKKNGDGIRFNLSSQILFELMQRIDDLGPAQFGFHYDRILKQECEFLVPYPIDELASVDKILEPFIRWRLNSEYLNCCMIGLVLQLFIIHRLIRFDKKFKKADFTELINALENCPIETIEPTFESAVRKITEEVREDEQD